ncbi:hypothetical protein DFH27DRAFT_537261 [Peziza echinospora]|nr:hypothetical protein DFH27DRAFT_537261 [Peziza echinospora]
MYGLTSLITFFSLSFMAMDQDLVPCCHLSILSVSLIPYPIIRLIVLRHLVTFHLSLRLGGPPTQFFKAMIRGTAQEIKLLMGPFNYLE